MKVETKLLTVFTDALIQPLQQTVIFDTNPDIYHQMSESLLDWIQEKICQGPDKYVDQSCIHTGWGEAWSLGL